MIQANPLYQPASAHAGRYRLLYGGAGSGKSVFVAQDELQRALLGRRVLVIRKVARTIRHSTFALFRELVSALRWTALVQVNKTDMTLSFQNGGEIIHAGLDDVEKLKSIAGIDRIWIEEATELTRADLEQVDLRLRGPEAEQITYTFNPTLSAKQIFQYVGVPTTDLPHRNHRTYADGQVYVQHTTYLDNPYAGASYTEVFQRLSGSTREVYEHGLLSATDAPDQLIPYADVKRAMELEPAAARHDGRQRLGVDVARYGDDETVLQYFQGYALRETIAFQGQDTAHTARLTQTLIRERGIPAELVAVDTVGLGAGVADQLRAAGLRVTDIVSGAAAVPARAWKDGTPTFNNLRSQMWYYARTALADGAVSIATAQTDARLKLQEDLLAPRYRIGMDKRWEVEPKDSQSANWSIKKRLGRSTDYGDAFVYGLFAEHMGSALRGRDMTRQVVF